MLFLLHGTLNVYPRFANLPLLVFDRNLGVQLVLVDGAFLFAAEFLRA